MKRRIVLVCVLLAGTVGPSAAAAPSRYGGPYDSDRVYTHRTCGAPPPAQAVLTAACVAEAHSDARTGSMLLQLSVTTPGGGALPGWGTARGTGAIVARRMIPRATRASTFRVDFRIGPVAMRNLRLGRQETYLGVTIKARHLTCSACRAHVWSEGWQGSFAPRDMSASLTLRNRDDPAKLMPSGPVEVEIIFHGRAHSPPVTIGGNYVTPIFVLPPGVGRSAIRAELAVLSIRPLS